MTVDKAEEAAREEKGTFSAFVARHFCCKTFRSFAFLTLSIFYCPPV